PTNRPSPRSFPTASPSSAAIICARAPPTGSPAPTAPSDSAALADEGLLERAELGLGLQPFGARVAVGDDPRAGQGAPAPAERRQLNGGRAEQGGGGQSRLFAQPPAEQGAAPVPARRLVACDHLHCLMLGRAGDGAGREGGLHHF